MKIFISIVLCCFYYLSLSQINKPNLDFFDDRELFVSKKLTPKYKDPYIKSEIIIFNDTLVSTKQRVTKYNFNKVCEARNNFKLFLIFGYSAFTEKVNKETFLMQWRIPIIVFFDKSFSKETIKAFKTFFKPIESLEHLKISYTNNKGLANYHILASEKEIPLYNYREKTYYEKMIFSKATYKLTKDRNFGYINGKLFIDLQNISNKENVLKKLKHIFFITLGNFRYNIKVDISSLLFNNDKSGYIISDFDIKLLKLHYFKIHQMPFSFKKFRSLFNEHKKICYPNP